MRFTKRPTISGLRPICSGFLRDAPRNRRPRLEVLEDRNLLSLTATIAGRYLFYDQSKFDGNVAGISASDDLAIAADKTAALSGIGNATFASVSSYSKGINGVMIDIAGPHGVMTASDFTFKVGNNNSPASWSTAPAPSAFTVRAGAGLSGSDRVEIVWPAGSITKEWLGVVVGANQRTGLATSDAFFFGNLIGDSGNGDSANSLITNATDEIATRNNQGIGASITNIFDYSRDGIVNAVDQIAARSHVGILNRLNVSFGLPTMTAALANDTGASNTDGITADPTVSGTLTTPNPVASFKAGLNGGPVTTDVLPYLSAGTFTLDTTLLATLNGGTLADGAYVLHLEATDGFGLGAAAELAFILNTAAPTVTASTIASFTDDLTPHVTVTVTGPAALPNGTQVRLDVDLNSDGDFSDAGESARTLSTLYAGKSYFQLTPALPATNAATGPYLVNWRVRVTDQVGNEGVSPLQSLLVDTLESNALLNYVNAPDASYTFDTPTTVTGSGYTAKVYDLTSQTWRSLADVNKPVWHHWLTVIVPTGNLAQLSTTALLNIDGGGNNEARPTAVDANLAGIATTLNTIVINLRMVPSEPLIFTGDPGNSRSEDEIIAYSLNQFATHLGEPGNESWPVLLPMVKSAVRAMDTVQMVDQGLTGGKDVLDFVVSGGSKRGWTTWLTAAVDNRVSAIVPRVFDALNLDEQFIHHHAFYDGIPAGPTFTDGFSIAIQDYVNFSIPENSQYPANQEVTRIIDPYRYLNNGRFNIPKLLLNSAQDEFFVSDSADFYFSDLPGTQNYLRYIPNVGHGLNSAAVANSATSFMNAVIKNLTLPQYSWTVEQDGSIHVQTSSSPTQVLLWQGTNSTYRDFRKGYNPSIPFTSSTLTDQGGGVYVANVAAPATGATAFFVELTYTSPLSGKPYIFTTQVRVASNVPLGPWPFYVATNGVPAAQPAIAGGMDAVAFSLASPAIAGGPPVVQPLVWAATDAAVALDDEDSTEEENSSWAEDDHTAMNDDLDVAATDMAIEQLGDEISVG